jgi:hypothetical protein
MKLIVFLTFMAAVIAPAASAAFSLECPAGACSVWSHASSFIEQSLCKSHGGLWENGACQCECGPGALASWDSYGCSCQCPQTFALPCSSHGTVDSKCFCLCDDGWYGPDCTASVHYPGDPGDFCALFVCEHGAKNPDTCECDCEGGWDGHVCSRCDLDNTCTGQGTFDPDMCQCECPLWASGVDCQIPTFWLIVLAVIVAKLASLLFSYWLHE